MGEQDLDWVRQWVEESGYPRSLGVKAEDLLADAARLTLDYRDECSNGDQALHGGVAASMISLAAGGVARACLGLQSGPWHSVAVQVGYLSAAIGEGVVADARLLRRGKELAYVDVDVTGNSGKAVAKGLVTVRGRFDELAVATPVGAAGDEGSDPGPMGPFIASIPFHSLLGISVEHMTGGRSRIVMPFQSANADLSGGVHEGAVLGLIDTTGAMAAWAKTGPGRYKASTPGLQARILEPLRAGDLIGFGHVVHHDRELLFCDVEVHSMPAKRVVAHGTVNYRIVTPEVAR